MRKGAEKGQKRGKIERDRTLHRELKDQKRKNEKRQKQKSEKGQKGRVVRDRKEEWKGKGRITGNGQDGRLESNRMLEGK